MHTLARVCQPLILSVDGAPITPEEYAIIAATGPELQRWWLAHGVAMLVADPIEVPPRADFDPPRFHVPGQAFWATLDFVRNRYPALIGGEHIPLVWLKGVNAAELGSLGWGGLGLATVSWDTVLNALGDPWGRGHWPAGIAAHELGHGLGHPHITDPAPNVMWEWWSWPSVNIPPMTTPHPSMVVMSVRAMEPDEEDTGAVVTQDACPLPVEVTV